MSLSGMQVSKPGGDRALPAPCGCLTDLDEDGLKYVLKNLPAWVKVRRYTCGLYNQRHGHISLHRGVSTC